MRPDLPRRRLLAATVVAAVLTSVLGGCALTREPVNTPRLPLPDALPAVDGATVDLPNPWWTIFVDDTLDALVREALASNTDLQAAASAK